jgi:pyridoxamine 5'-phosphate oxidase
MKRLLLPLFWSLTCIPLHADVINIDKEKIIEMRRSYAQTELNESIVDPNPIKQFRLWLQEASENPLIVEANVMILSTIHDSQPVSRSILLRDFKDQGFVFFTNLNSEKVKAFKKNSRVSLLFPWYAIERQVQVQGIVTYLNEKEADAYFETLDWSSQIGAWVSQTSARLELELKWKEFANKHPKGSKIKRPKNFGVFLVIPKSIEFFQARYPSNESKRTYGYAERIRYTKQKKGWKMQ